MPNYAFLTAHPLKLDDKGLPTANYDTDRYIHACGSDGVVYLDGRLGRLRQIQRVKEHIQSLSKIHPLGTYAGFEIHTGASILRTQRTGYYGLRYHPDAPDRYDRIGYFRLPVSKEHPRT